MPKNLCIPRGGSSISIPPPPMLLADIKNQLKNPCLMSVWNKGVRNGFSNDISHLLNNHYEVNFLV